MCIPSFIPSYELPVGTIVYFCESEVFASHSEFIVSHILPFGNKDHRRYFSFTFDDKDGLWASLYVRQLWKKEIHSHPHCTLFDMLYSKLDG